MKRKRFESIELQGWPMYILGVLAFLFSAHAVLANQPTPILPDPKLTPGDIFDVTAQDVCVPGYAKKVRRCQRGLKDRPTPFDKFMFPTHGFKQGRQKILAGILRQTN